MGCGSGVSPRMPALMGHDAAMRHGAAHSRHGAAHPRHRVPARRVRPGQTGQHLGRIAEGEVVQQHRHVLQVGAQILRRAHHQGRRHQPLLLQTVMRVHPVRARPCAEIVLRGSTGRDRRGEAGVGDPVLCRGRRLPVPVHDRRFAGLVVQLDPERLAEVEPDAMRAVRLRQCEHGGRSAVHLQHARAGHQPLRDRLRAGGVQHGEGGRGEQGPAGEHGGHGRAAPRELRIAGGGADRAHASTEGKNIDGLSPTLTTRRTLVARGLPSNAA